MSVDVENTTPAPMPVSAPTTEFLSDTDRHALEMAKMKRALAASNAEAVELAYNNLILQFVMRYRLTDVDMISETGQIVRGGAVK